MAGQKAGPRTRCRGVAILSGGSAWVQILEGPDEVKLKSRWRSGPGQGFRERFRGLADRAWRAEEGKGRISGRRVPRGVSSPEFRSLS